MYRETQCGPLQLREAILQQVLCRMHVGVHGDVQSLGSTRICQLHDVSHHLAKAGLVFAKQVRH